VRSLIYHIVAAQNDSGKARVKEGKQSYADGTPFDTLRYLQGKLLLKPDRLSSLDRFRELGKLARRTAKSLNVGFREDPDVEEAPRVREIVFVDTPDFRLYNNGFILRRRITYVDGFPAGDPEIVFKFRYPDLQRAAALDVRPRISGEYRLKFKAQALPHKNHLGGYRVLYSHNCKFGVSQVHEDDRLAMSTLVRVFPPLAALKRSNEDRVRLVNEGIVEELLLPLGKLDFGKGIVAKSNISLWRTRGGHRPLVGEYSYDMKFDRREDVPRKAENLVKQFFVTLQRDISDWIWLGSTKTGIVYHLDGSSRKGHE
jgi:hypothetical protein